jgi:3-oxoacyl-[acyl-carrier protein] reductase
MPSKLSGKVAIVTGASKGIGAEISRGLAAEGASVVVNYSSSRAAADKVVADIKSAGRRAFAVQGDMSNAADVKRVFTETTNAFGRLDVLVNNAGVFKFAPFAEITEESFHWHYNINVLGPILTTLEALKHFGATGGSVINISSIVGSNPRPMAGLYASSKAAINSLTRTMALELGSRKIRVNAIAPGHTKTEGTDSISLFEGEGAALANESPFKRFGQPQDIARVAVFLASDDSAWITGEVIRAAGGTI